MLNIVVLAAIIAVAVSLAWCSVRCWRNKNIVIKWAGTGLAALLTAVLSLAGAGLVAGMFKLEARHAPVPDIKVAGTAAEIERGRALTGSFCGACHATNDQLAGGIDLADDLPLPIGSFVSSNLTPAGNLPLWSDGE